MKYEGIIFDLDGTLLNTFQDIKNAVEYVLIKMKSPLRTKTEYLNFIGRGLRSLLYQSFPEDRKNDQSLEEGLILFQKYYERNLLNNTVMYEGIWETLLFLQKSQVSMSVLSNKKDCFVRSLLEHFFDLSFFVNPLGVFGEHKHKPDPALALTIAKKMNMSCEKILFVGDSLVDIQTAKNAGFASAFVLWGFSPKHLTFCKPDHILSSPLELLEFFKS